MNELQITLTVAIPTMLEAADDKESAELEAHALQIAAAVRAFPGAVEVDSSAEIVETAPA
jgi:hypothetical protein